MENLEYRMYGFVPYNISEIQKGIQFGHAVVEYSNLYSETDEYIKWSEYDKTFIILNGGTTNNKQIGDGYFGSLNNLKEEIYNKNIKIASFNEPDLGDQLTAFVFLVDERVFNREKYPEFRDWIIEIDYTEYLIYSEKWSDITRSRYYNKWVEIIGGETNIWLRDFLKNRKLA